MRYRLFKRSLNVRFRIWCTAFASFESPSTLISSISMSSCISYIHPYTNLTSAVAHRSMIDAPKISFTKCLFVYILFVWLLINDRSVCQGNCQYVCHSNFSTLIFIITVSNINNLIAECPSFLSVCLNVNLSDVSRHLPVLSSYLFILSRHMLISILSIKVTWTNWSVLNIINSLKNVYFYMYVSMPNCWSVCLSRCLSRHMSVLCWYLSILSCHLSCPFVCPV